MSIYDWYRLPVKERQRIAGQHESIEDLCSFMVSELCEMSKLYKDYGNKGEQ